MSENLNLDLPSRGEMLEPYQGQCKFINFFINYSFKIKRNRKIIQEGTAITKTYQTKRFLFPTIQMKIKTNFQVYQTINFKVDNYFFSNKKKLKEKSKKPKNK